MQKSTEKFVMDLEPGTWIRIDQTHPLGISYAHDAIVSRVCNSNSVRGVKVVHFRKEEGKVLETGLDVFLQGGSNPRIVTEPPSVFPDHVIVKKAQSQIGRADYTTLGKNCKHFCRWCCTGVPSSHDVNAYGNILIGIGIGAFFSFTYAGLFFKSMAKQP